MTAYFKFTQARTELIKAFKERGVRVFTETWQALDVRNKPDMETYELLNETIKVDLGHSNLKRYQLDVRPNLPWTDDHFAERVCGEPLNPPPSEAWWPHARDNSRFKDEHGRFSHSYPERYWPKYAGRTDKGELSGTIYDLDQMGVPAPNRGIRYDYGDLADVMGLLLREPHTRQAYLPIFYPEDTGAMSRQRIPCSLGYHFIMRQQQLHIVYYLRSCDFANHMADDIYLTIRLLLWVLGRLAARDRFWGDVKPGSFTMHITSLHLFVNDYLKLMRDPT